MSLRLLNWKLYLSFLGVRPLPADIENRVQVEQLIIRARLSLPLAAVGIIVVLLLALDFKSKTGNIGLDLVFLSIIIAYICLFYNFYCWNLLINKSDNFSLFSRRLHLNLFLIGSFWGLLVVVLKTMSTLFEAQLIYGIIVALMSTAVFSSPASWAFAFWIPVTSGGFLSVFLAKGPLDIAALICLVVYSILTLFSIIFLNNKMTDRAVNAIRLEESNEIVGLLLRDFQENSSDWLWEADEHLVLKQGSPRLAEVLGQPMNALKDLPLLPLLRSGSQEAQSDPEPLVVEKPLDILLASIADRVPFRDLSVPVVIRDERRWWSLTGKPVLDKAGTFLGYRGVGSDVTLEQRSRERITYLARYDSLTNLANRNEFDEVLQQACPRSEWSPFALLYLDLDDFKTINDTYGHAVGDAVLSVVAERIRGCIREGDVAGRLGGDEFAIFVNSGDSAEACRVANRIIDRLSRPFRLDEVVLELGISIGIALAPLHGTIPGILSRNADLALYRAKLEGRGDWRLYSPDEDGGFHDSRVLQMDLRRAVAGNQFFLLFQPLIDIHTGQVAGLEALLRWMHPERGLVMPSSFIPMAEQSGLIGPIGKWVIREACGRAAGLPRSVCVAINLSPAQLRDETLIEAIDQALAETGVHPGQIEFEITEAVNLTTCEQTLKILQWVRARGIRITIDDFGTGYSSLTLLRRFRFDKVKIDQSFIQDLGAAAPGEIIVKSIIDLGHDMGMVVTAEGVETAAQVEILRLLGCDEAQGYLFAQPLSSNQLAEFVARRHLPAAMASSVV